MTILSQDGSRGNPFLFELLFDVQVTRLIKHCWIRFWRTAKLLEDMTSSLMMVDTHLIKCWQVSRYSILPSSQNECFPKRNGSPSFVVQDYRCIWVLKYINIKSRWACCISALVCSDLRQLQTTKHFKSNISIFLISILLIPKKQLEKAFSPTLSNQAAVPMQPHRSPPSNPSMGRKYASLDQAGDVYTLSTSFWLVKLICDTETAIVDLTNSREETTAVHRVIVKFMFQLVLIITGQSDRLIVIIDLPNDSIAVCSRFQDPFFVVATSYVHLFLLHFAFYLLWCCRQAGV